MLARCVPTDQFDPIVRWIQCGLGGLTAGLYYLFARRAFRSLGVGVVAGMLCALHPFWVVDTAALNDGTLASFLVGLVLFTGARAGQTGGPFASLLYGLSLAGMALVRAALLPFAFVGLAWFLLRSRRQPSGWLGALLAFLGFVIGVAPVDHPQLAGLRRTDTDRRFRLSAHVDGQQPQGGRRPRGRRGRAAGRTRSRS